MCMDNIGFLTLNDTAQCTGYYRVWEWRMVTSFCLFIKPTGALRCTFDAVDLNALVYFKFRGTRRLQCGNSDLMTTFYEFHTEILDVTFLTSNDRRVELR